MTQKIEKRQCIEKATQEAFTVVNKKETETRKKQVKEERIPQSTKTDVLLFGLVPVEVQSQGPGLDQKRTLK